MLSLYLYQGDRTSIPSGWYHGTVPRAASVMAWTWDPTMHIAAQCDTTNIRVTFINSQQGWIHGSRGWNKGAQHQHPSHMYAVYSASHAHHCVMCGMACIGRHAWQVTVNAFTGSWFCFAVAARTLLTRADSWRDPSFWGWSNVSFAYRGAHQTPETTDWASAHVFHCVLDLDAPSRSFTVLNVTTGRSVSIP